MKKAAKVVSGNYSITKPGTIGYVIKELSGGVVCFEMNDVSSPHHGKTFRINYKTIKYCDEQSEINEINWV